MTGAATVPRRRITGRMVLIGLFVFFGTVFAVNGVFIYLALDSWPGLTTGQAYRQGLDYDDTLAAAKAQARRGWHSSLTVETLAGGDRLGIAVRMTAKDGAPLEGLAVTIGLSRPVGEDVAVAAALEDRGGGLYRAEIGLPIAGRWRAEITARSGDDVGYRMVHDVMVAP